MLTDVSMTPCHHFQSCVSYIFLTEELVNRKISPTYLLTYLSSLGPLFSPDCLLSQEKRQKFIVSFEIVLFYEKCLLIPYSLFPSDICG